MIGKFSDLLRVSLGILIMLIGLIKSNESKVVFDGIELIGIGVLLIHLECKRK